MIEPQASCDAHLPGLDAGGLRRLFSQAQCRSLNLRRREFLFREGQQPDHLYLIVSGSVKLYKSGLHHHQEIVRIAAKGELIGYRAFFAEEPYSASAEAREATKLCVLGRGTFEALVQNHAEISRNLIRDLSKELRSMREELLSRRDESAEERLLRCIRRQTALEEGAGPAPLKRVELASMIGCEPETVSRILQRLQKKQVIRLKGQAILPA